MISEGSCDTKDWSNDAENSVSPSQKKKMHLHNEIENSYNIKL